MIFRQVRIRINEFIQSQSIGGIVLGVAAVLAMMTANSGFSAAYASWQHIPGTVQIGPLLLHKPLLLWINDFWMAIFFLLVGLEIKRELLEGELAGWHRAMLPLIAAAGGMLVPALIYSAMNWHDAVAIRGWAIPSATDIAFALGILALLGKHAPPSLKVFLAAVAIIDDLGAIIIIALFYTANLSLPMLAVTGVGALLLLALNRLRVMAVMPYIVVGAIVWLGLLKSGVHATLAGVITAIAIPLSHRRADGHQVSPLKRLEHDLHPWVTFLILPAFAFTNAGVSLLGVTLSSLLTSSIPLGISLGLVLGKAVGVFGSSWIVFHFLPHSRPQGASVQQFLGVCILCGVGFTMSLFIGSLAFPGEHNHHMDEVKIGVLLGSLCAGVVGALVLRVCAARTSA